MTDTDSADALAEAIIPENAPPNGMEADPAEGPDGENTPAAAEENTPAPEDEGDQAEASGGPEANGEEPGESDLGEAGEAPPGEGENEAESEEAPAEGGTALPLAAVVEAILFAAREPLKIQTLARAAGRGTRQEAVREAVAELNLHYLETGRAFEIAEISGRLQLLSRPEYAAAISRLYPKKQGDSEKAARLTPPALETLAVIAYKQPATRAEVERIRGCGCGPALRSLVERGSVRVAGKRADLVGQPLLYATTEAFLAEFGLGSLDELPLRNEFMGLSGGGLPAPDGPDGEPPRVLEIAPAPERESASPAEDTEPAEDIETAQTPAEPVG